MYLFLLLLWVVFNGRITLEILLIGAGICAWLYWFMCKYMDYNTKREAEAIKKLPFIIKYVFVLIFEIGKSNIDVIRIILSPKMEMEPILVTFQTDLKTEVARVALANSITLTPGTFTIGLEDDTYVIHALDKAFGQGVTESVFVKQLRKLEG